MKTKKNLVALLLSIFVVGGLLSLPNVSYAILLPFGGRITFSMPAGYFIPPFGPYCPPHSVIFNIAISSSFGPMGILLPPGNPRAFYNFIKSGVQTLGDYVPTPLLVCPLYPVYPGNFFGTSLR